MGAGPETTLEFNSTQDTIISGLASNMKLLAVALLLLAPLRLVYGAVDVAGHPVAGVLSLVEGAFTGLLGMVMLKAATDARYMVETKGYDKEHMMNWVESLTVFYRVLVGIGSVVLVVSAVRVLINL
jgi:hypothetical protein